MKTTLKIFSTIRGMVARKNSTLKGEVPCYNRDKNLRDVTKKVDLFDHKRPIMYVVKE